MKTYVKAVACLMFTVGLLLSNYSNAQAQYFNFGKNRIQYETFNWRFIQTEHFDIYYYQSKNYDLAVFAALSLESALKQYQEDFDHRIVERIEVIIYDSQNDFVQTNVVSLPINTEGIGGVTDLFKNRITIPFTGSYDSFRAVLQHELNHAVLNDMFYGGSIQNAIGRGAVQLPGWFNEGLAEFESKGWDTETDAFIRNAVLNDNLASIKRLRGYMAYRGGQSIWNYIVQEYGRNKIAEILNAVQATRSIEAAFKRTLGVSLKELSNDWQNYYREIYFPSVNNRTRIEEFAQQLTNRDNVGSYNTSPSLSPEGDRIAIISNKLRSFNIYILNTITGEVIQTLIEGRNNISFAAFNILTPNLSWKPDGSKIALSAKYKGRDRIAIVGVGTGEKQFFSFEQVDAIGSVAWSPDGNKIAFSGSDGPYQDIYVYNLQTKELKNITHDAPSDLSPVWGPNSEKIYFTSSRGDQLELGELRVSPKLLAQDDMYTSDIYAVELGSSEVVRLTNTPDWNEYQPEITKNGTLYFLSDENGISNIYKMDIATHKITPLTNLQTGASQFSLNADGSVAAISSINNKGNLDIYTVTNLLSRKGEVQDTLSDSYWAKRRKSELRTQRVPAIKYVQQMARSKSFLHISESLKPIVPTDTVTIRTSNKPAVQDTIGFAQTITDTTNTAVAADTTKPQQVQEEEDNGDVDFRNYVFAEEITQDSTFVHKYMDKRVFDVDNNTSDDGRYVPTDYRLKFTVDLVFGGGGFSTYYGTYGLAQIRFSDLLGNHVIAFGSSLQFDLVNSNYFLQYGNFKGRTDLLFTLSHSAFNINRAERYRSLSGSFTVRYPLNTYERLDFKMAGINISYDFSLPGVDQNRSKSSAFLYPQIIYTNDRSVQGLLTPIAGYRYSVKIGGSPPISNETLQFASILGDFRKYIHIGGRYSLALRFSGGASFGRDSQSFFMGGVLGWINGKAFDYTTPSIDNLGQIFITAPAVPLRGFERYSMSGDKFGVFNLEFRFPLFAAILPGPIPIIPLYNITGLAFIDAGVAWGQPVYYTVPGDPNIPDISGNEDYYFKNSSDLDFSLRTQDKWNGLPAPKGDILLGAGFGLRAIIFGIPLRYDIGWPYYRDGFGSDPIHYISIGIDF